MRSGGAVTPIGIVLLLAGSAFLAASREGDPASAEDDDIHLVISSHRRARTMIVEFPNVRCNGARDSIKKRAMRRARNQLTAACGFPSSSFTPLDGKARITGVGFFDLLHGQRGVAPNGIELHPVLRFDHADC